MSQAPDSTHERRGEPRHPAAFAFWFQAAQTPDRASAWMTDVSASGASFLTSADRAPNLGDRIQLAEMFSQDRLVREEHLRLPGSARVVRIDPASGVTRQVAVRFEAGVSAGLPIGHPGHFAAECPEQRAAPASPPPPLSPGDPPGPALTVPLSG